MTANGRTRPDFRVPPRPVLLDWLWAGACAGLVFGLAELAVAVPAGSALDPRLAALVLGIDSALVALVSFLVGAILRSRSVRTSRSGLVGAVVGPLLFAAIAGRSWSALTAGGLPELIDFAGLMTAALFATAAGLAAARLANGLEQRGVICSAPYVWGGVALLLAASERLADGAHFTALPGVIVATVLILSTAGAAWTALEIAKRRASRAPRAFGWLLTWLVIVSIGAAASPTLLPWIFYDLDAPEIGIGPPNFLIATVPDPNRAESSHSVGVQAVTPTLLELAFGGATYEILPEPFRAEARAPLIDSRDTPVVSQLSAAGYATAAILPGGNVPQELAVAELDAQPGARRLLEGPLAWLGAAPLLNGPALPLMRLLGLDSEARAADRLAERAKAWLLDWRTERAGAPFFLFVDFRNAAPPANGETLLERSDARLGDILEHLLMLGVQDSTLVVVLSGDETGTSGRGRPSRAVMRPPMAWPRPTRAAQAGLLRSGQLGDFLLEASRSDGTSPVTLPGATKTQ